MRTTTIQLDELTDRRINELIEWGYGKTLIAVVRRAVEEEWFSFRFRLQQENVGPPPARTKGKGAKT